MKRILAALLAIGALAAGTVAGRTNLSPGPASAGAVPGQRDELKALHPLASLRSDASTTRARGREEGTPAKPTYLVLIVLDGAQPGYFDVPHTPHLHALIHNGTRFTNAFAGILESETPSGHATLASGSTPNRDGILSFNWSDADNNEVNLFTPDAINSGQMERIMGRAPAPDIATLVHRADRGAKVVALSGSKYYAADAIGGPSADVIMYYHGTSHGQFVPRAVPGHVPPAGVLQFPGATVPNHHIPPGVEDHLTMRLAINAFRHLHQKVTLMNLPEFDWPLGHVYGGFRSPAKVRFLMQQFDRDLGSLEDAYRSAGVLDRTLFVVTADHGMAPAWHKVDKDSVMAAVARAGTPVVTDSFHTAAYIWVRDRSKAEQAAENVAALHNPFVQSVYFKERTSKGYDYVRVSGPNLLLAPGTEAANQYLLGTFVGPEGPDVVAFFTEDTASLPGGQASWRGDHGGNAWRSQHMPLVISGPGVRKGVISKSPVPLIDIAPTALSLMGIADAGMQGIPLAEAISSPSTGIRTKRKSQTVRLWPVIEALSRESAAEVKAGK